MLDEFRESNKSTQRFTHCQRADPVSTEIDNLLIDETPRRKICLLRLKRGSPLACMRLCLWRLRRASTSMRRPDKLYYQPVHQHLGLPTQFGSIYWRAIPR